MGFSHWFWFLKHCFNYYLPWLLSVFGIFLKFASEVSWQWHPTPVLLPGKSHGRRSLEGCSPWGCWGLDATERLHFHFSLSCIGEGNGNPLQCSCLENPRDGVAWWAAVYGVAQSQTRLKWLSSRKQNSKPFCQNFWIVIWIRYLFLKILSEKYYRKTCKKSI